ncbi:Ig-like domain-containing protein [Bacteroidales bacterium OttesenSCG-928-I21]|nr:Ig-like domain-containing protein [Bacteroidales bacterium OttesenSCG-928-I21]
MNLAITKNKPSPRLHLAVALILFLVVSCAKQTTPSGGPVDVTPPQMINAEPPIETTNFNENIIQIKFDEFIRLNNVNQKLIVSPPIEEIPTVLLTGKGLKIKLNPELLQPNTTYTLNFTDAIADNNENNAINSFVYAFSTGDYVDSLSFSGYVLDSYTKKPTEDVWVILHNNLSDTAISTLAPSYITKTDKAGKFLIPYIQDNDYKIYALKDGNYNHKFDLPTEAIAFIDSIFHPSVELISKLEAKSDTLMLDILKLENIDPDSITSKPLDTYKNIPENIELLLFIENRQTQFIKSHKRLTDNQLEIIFNSTQYEDFRLKVDGDDNIITYSKNNPDTINVWLQNSELFSCDTLRVFLDYRDPIFTDTIHQDTLRFKKFEKEDKDTVLKLNISTGTLPYKYLIVNTKTPFIYYDSTKIKLELKKDTNFVKVDFNLQKDSLNPLKLLILSNIDEKAEYRIIADSGFIKNIKGITNFTDTILLKTASIDEFGSLKINFNNISKNYIVQLLQNEVLQTEQISEKGTVNFLYLKPGSYKIRVIEDINGNKRWDTGNLMLKKQPEPVYYYTSDYEIKSNWKHEIDWKPIRNISTQTNENSEKEQKE